MRPLAAVYVVAAPTGARIRTRLRPSTADARVLWAVGAHLGRLAGQDLALRCRLGAGDDQRATRKRALTAAATSRWAGARLAEVEQRLAAGRVSVCRGGGRLARLRHALDCCDVAATEADWRTRWRASRLFLTADGEAGKSLGNETIRVHPDEQWLELRLPAPPAHLSNRPHGRYRLGCRVTFSYRAAEWAAQATSGAVAYTIWLDPVRGRWYLDCSWRPAARPAPSLQTLRQYPAFAVDLNADHLAGWALDATGNPLGPPHTVALDLDGLSSSTRDGRLRAAVAQVIRLGVHHGCRSIVIEDLDFADAGRTGRETLGRGRRGKRFRRVVAGIPTRKFRDLLVGMAANAGLWVVAVDPAWTSVWGGRYWRAALNQQTRTPVTVSRHHAAAVVIGRRGLGYRARRRGWCAWRRPEDRQQRATDSAGRPVTTAMPSAWRLIVPKPTAQGPDGPGGQRAGPSAHKTRLPKQEPLGDQAAQDRSVPTRQP